MIVEPYFKLGYEGGFDTDPVSDCEIFFFGCFKQAKHMLRAWIIWIWENYYLIHPESTKKFHFNYYIQILKQFHAYEISKWS